MNEIVEAKEEVVEFDYSLVDKETSEFLKEKEFVMQEAIGNMRIRVGKELREAQDKLTKGKYGCFEEWYTSLGFKKHTVYRLIERYNLIVASSNNEKIIEDMPSILVREISKENVDTELKEKVLSGEIKTTKEYRQLKEQKEMAERIVKQLEEEKKQVERVAWQAEQSLKEAIEENEQLKNRPIERVEIPVPTIPMDYEHTKESNAKLEQKITNLSRLVEDKELQLEDATKEKEILERKAKLNERDSEKYKQLKDEIENLSKEKNDLGRQIKSRTELSGLVVRIEHILKTELAPVKYSRAIDEASTDEIVTRNLRDIVGRVESWCQDMYEYIPKVQGNENIIDVEVVEYE